MTVSDRPPYPGLRPFERDEGDLFFGRDDCVDAMLAQLAKTRFLAVLGSSGTGKSSLVKTGLLSGLEMGLLAGSRWRFAEFRPMGDPLGKLAEALLRGDTAETPSAADVVHLRGRFKREGPRELVKWCSEGHLPEGTNLLLLVDQFEELFRYQSIEEREEAQAFVSLLLESRGPRTLAPVNRAPLPIYVTITMRSEYLGACALMLGLAEAVNAGMYLTPRMTREQCEEAIVGPALVCGVEIEDRLVTRILNDMADFAPWEEQQDGKDQLSRLARQADQLPLMQYALNQMWLRAKETKDTLGEEGPIRLRLDRYRGLERELDARGDAVFAALRESSQVTARKVFQAVTLGSTAANAERRRTKFGDLVEICGEGSRGAVEEVFAAFGPGGCQFLTSDIRASGNHSPPDGGVIDISHESLIRQWGRLSCWVREEHQSAETYRDIERSAGRWKEHTGDLLSKLDLSVARRWLETERPSAAWAARYGDAFDLAMEFLRRSKRHRLWRRGLATMTIVVPLIVICGAFWSMYYEITALMIDLVYLDPASEYDDYGVKPQAVLKQEVGIETPKQIPGGGVIGTSELKAALDSGELNGAPFVLVDALAGQHEQIPSAHWLPYAGSGGNFHDDNQSRLAKDLKDLTQENRNTSLVFYCEGSNCWESYNASLRAMYLGYSHVYWYRGGLLAWREATTMLKKLAVDKMIPEDKRLSRIPVKASTVWSHIPAINIMIEDRIATAFGQVLPMFSSTNAAGEVGAEFYYLRGVADAKERNYDDAIADFTVAINRDQLKTDYYHQRGLAYAVKQDYADAKADLDKAAALDPTKAALTQREEQQGPAFAMLRANGAYDKGDYEQAIENYTQVMDLFEGNSAEASRKRGISYFYVGNFDRAIADLTRATDLDPRDAAAFFYRCGAYLDKNDNDRAIADCTKAIDLGSTDAYKGRAAAYFSKGDYDRAIGDLGREIASNRDDSAAYRIRGLIYSQQNRYDDAIRDYTKAITLDPANSVGYRDRGDAYYAKNDKDNYDLAIADYTKAIALAPKDALNYRDRGNAYYQQGDYAHAISDYTQAIVLEPTNPLGYRDRGDAYYAKDDKDDYGLATADYSKAIALAPKDALNYRDRGNAYYQQDDYAHAISDYTQAIALEPTNPLGYLERGRAYRATGELRPAIADYDRSIAIDGKRASAYDDRGNAYFALGDYHSAAVDYTQAIALDPKDSWGYISRGVVDFYSGSLPDALHDVERASAFDPTYPYAAIWLEIVNQHSHLPSGLTQATAKIDMSKWPAPVIRLYLGELTPEQVQAAANTAADADTKFGQVCEANFYVGELALEREEIQDAARLFGLAAASCPLNFLERAAATAELRRLNESH